MKKKSIIVTVLLAAAMLLSVPTYAQVFLQDEELEGSLRVRGNGSGLPGIPDPGGGGSDVGPINNYTPLGGGILVLGCLGGIYLLDRRRKERE